MQPSTPPQPTQYIPRDETAPIAQHAANEGANNILTGAKNQQGADAWQESTVQEMVLGPCFTQSTWKLEELEKFDSYKLACFVTRWERSPGHIGFRPVITAAKPFWLYW